MVTIIIQLMRISLAFIFLLNLTTSCVASDNSATVQIDDAREQQLMHLLLADCGSCHGMTLQGGLGPSLLAEDLKIRSDGQLFNTIKNGALGTPMPPWEQFLNDTEINWMITTLRQQSWKKQESNK